MRTNIDCKTGKRIKSPLKAIKEHCLDCCCDQPNEVKLCQSTNCPLYDFRFGKNPYAKRVLTEEQKARYAAWMLKARESLR